jgi:hypothetical protein
MSNIPTTQERKDALFQAIHDALQRLAHDYYLNTSEARKAIDKLESQ